MRKLERIISIFILVAFCFMLTGCFKSSGGKGEDAVKGFLAAVSKNDSELAKTYLSNPDDYESLVAVASRLGLDKEKSERIADQYSGIKYTVGKAKKGSDASKATVVVSLTVPDYSEAFAKGIQAVDADMTDANAMKTIIEKMADTKPEKIEKSVVVAVVKSGDKWLIDYSNNIELLNALNGNILNALNESLSL